jgi:hypothetical protein
VLGVRLWARHGRATVGLDVCARDPEGRW